MNESPLVSIITPLYNSEIFIRDTIESVLAQTYDNWEMIIVDDCSMDKGKMIVEAYAKQDIRIKLLSNIKNIGTAKSRNIAIGEARGKYIAFLDNDDVWIPIKLEKQITLMEKDNIFISYSAYDTINKEGKKIGSFLVQETVTYKDLLRTSLIGTLTMVYNTHKLGKFYFHGVGHEDYVMKLELLKKVKFARGINEPLAQYRILDDSLSRNKLRAARWQWHIYRDVEKLSYIKSIYYFIHYTYHGFTKYKKV